MKVVGSGYPCGPCELPVKCTCGTVLTEENVIDAVCADECEVCDYCGTGKCPDCGAHLHCGGCV